MSFFQLLGRLDYFRDPDANALMMMLLGWALLILLGCKFLAPAKAKR